MGFMCSSVWRPFCSVERDYLCNLVEGLIRNISVKIILNSDQWFRRRYHLKICLRKFYIYTHFIWEKILLCSFVCVILVEGILWNIHFKFGAVIQEEFFFLALVAILFGRAEPFVQFW